MDSTLCTLTTVAIVSTTGTFVAMVEAYSHILCQVPTTNIILNYADFFTGYFPIVTCDYVTK